MKEDFISKIKDYLSSRDELTAGYVFGSHAAGKEAPKSDIDIALLLNDTIDKREYGYIKLSVVNGLTHQLSFNSIDVIILNAASPLLAHEVMKKGVLLFSKDDAGRIQFAVSATRRYLDTIHLRVVQDRILHEKIRRGIFGHFEGSHKYSIEKVRKSAPDPSAVK